MDRSMLRFVYLRIGICALLFLQLQFSLKAQDSILLQNLQVQLKNKSLSDTAQVNKLISIAKLYRGTNKDSALKYVNKAVQLCISKNIKRLYDDVLYIKATIFYFSGDYKTSENLQMMSLKQAKITNDKEILSKNYNLLGALKYNMGKYAEAEKYYAKKLNICFALKDTSAIIETYYNISLIYQSIGDNETAIQYHFKILQLAQTFKDDEAMLLSSQGLAEIYTQVRDFKKATQYIFKANKIAVKLKDDYALAGVLIDRANIHLDNKHPDSAMYFYNQSIMLSQNKDDKYHEAIAFTGRANAYRQKGNYDTVVYFMREAIRLNKQINRVQGLASSWRILAEAQGELKLYDEAIKSSHISMAYATAINSLEDKKNIYQVIYGLYENLAKSDSAYFYYKLYNQCKDSINITAQLQGMARQEMMFERTRAEQFRQHEKQLASNQIEEQKQVRNIFIGVAIFVLVMLAFLFRNYLAKKKANIAISQQKKIIEEKNRDILDSINYSKRIQKAILTSNEEVKKILPNSFVYFNPKDIVSGDFYFIEPVETSDKNNWIAVALADCTGHGVPGAFMSIMGYNFLKQSLVNNTINGPGEALDFVNKQLHNFLRVNKSETTLRDGMDIAFCALNMNTHTLAYAGANNPVWLVTANTNTSNYMQDGVKLVTQTQTHALFEVIPNKQHIGYNEKIDAFRTIYMTLNKGDQLYLFTDGYADQFGGEKGKKFKYGNLQKLILSHAHDPMTLQMDNLHNAFLRWKGSHEQVDDVSLIGIKI